MAGDAPWWSADHEKNFYEAIIVVCLVLLAMLFEDVFHAVTHSAEHSYAYGASKDTHQNEEDRAHQHKQPFKELAQHLGTEFMTLGFLACVIFLCNLSGFFDFLADLGDSTYGGSSDAGGYDSASGADEQHRRLAGASGLLIGPANMPMPRTASDFLHLTEEVHIRMFFGMVLYFSIVVSIIQAGVARIKEWAELTNRRILMEVNKLHNAHDSALTEYQELTKYTIMHMVNWQNTDEERWDQLVMALFEEDSDSMCPIDKTELREDVESKLSHQFSLGHYLASTLEDGIVDIIELHRVTWASLMVLFVFFMFLHQQKVKMIYIAGAILLFGIFGMGLTYMQVRSQDHDIEASAHSCSCKEKVKEGEAPSPKKSANSFASGNIISGLSTKRIIGGFRFNQFVFLRVFETTIFVWCYSFASIIFNKQGWENEFLVHLVEALLYTIFTFVASSFLPMIVTHLFIQYSLPPYLDERHMKILIRTIRDNDPALGDLARTGADEIKQAISTINVNAHRGNGSSRFRAPSSMSMDSPVRNRSRAPTDTMETSEPALSTFSSFVDSSAGASYESYPIAPCRRPPPALVAMPPTLLGVVAPAPGSLADALSAVLATQEGLELVQKMIEEAARVRLAGIEQAPRRIELAQAAAAAVDLRDEDRPRFVSFIDVVPADSPIAAI